MFSSIKISFTFFFIFSVPLSLRMMTIMSWEYLIQYKVWYVVRLIEKGRGFRSIRVNLIWSRQITAFIGHLEKKWYPCFLKSWLSPLIALGFAHYTSLYIAISTLWIFKSVHFLTSSLMLCLLMMKSKHLVCSSKKLYLCNFNVGLPRRLNTSWL